jgi:hypothetical protein
LTRTAKNERRLKNMADRSVTKAECDLRNEVAEAKRAAISLEIKALRKELSLVVITCTTILGIVISVLNVLLR